MDSSLQVCSVFIFDAILYAHFRAAVVPKTTVTAPAADDGPAPTPADPSEYSF